jgi:hypothetical protein
MSTVDVATQIQDDKEVEPAEPETVRLGWDPSIVARPISFGWDAEPLVVDWDGQGRPDLLVTSGGGLHGRTARLYRASTPNGTFPPVYDLGTPVEGLDGLRCLCALPTGGAGRFDLLGLGEEGLVYLRNQGGADSPQFGTREPLGIGPDLGAGPARVAQIVATDWDGDGLVDLLVGLESLEGYWPDPLPVEQQVGFNRLGGHPGYDSSGCWRGAAPSARIRWLKNVGASGSPRFELMPEIGPEAGALDLDLNPAALAVAWGGGSAVELVASDRSGQIRLFRNFGGQRPPVVMDPRPLQVAGAPLELPDDRTTLLAADLDGDRRVELIYGTSDGRVFAIHSASGRDSARPPVPLQQEPGELALGGHAVLSAGDLDGDGGLDLIVGDGTGRLHWFKDLGQGSDHRYAEPIALEAGGALFRVEPGPDGRLLGPVAPSLGYACPCFVDWNGNGRPDLIVGGAGGEILLLRNDGARVEPRFAHPVPFRCGGAPLITPPRVRPAAAEWSTPGRVDLIALDLQGFLNVYPGAGTQDVEPPTMLVDPLGRLIRLDGSFGLGGRVALWAGNWTGSGRPDLLVGLPRNARFVIPGLTGKAVDSLDDLPTVILLENVGGGTLVPRLLRLADGSPLVVGTEGCSPSGIRGPDGMLDLIVGSDVGRVHTYSRSALRWLK